MSKSKTAISSIAFERVATGLVEALERGTEAWPLPAPPVQDPDFPAVAPISPQDLFEAGLGLLNIDRGMFDRHLSTVVDTIVPYRMNLTDDPFEVHERWLSKRMGDVADRLLFCIATDWLAPAVDPHAPNTDRWWLSIALLDGLSTQPYGQPVHQGYHLVESIALAERPGTWHTSPEPGPQQMEWNPHAVVPRLSSSLVVHDQGVEAARWMLERLENGSDDRRLLLMEWVRLLLERPALVEPLQLQAVLLRRALDPNPEVATKVTSCLAKAIEADREFGYELAMTLHGRDDVLVQRAMADVLTRLFRRLGEAVVPLLDDMLASEDESVLAAASATVGDLKFLDMEAWADRLKSLTTHPLAVVRRNLIPNLREYVEHDPADERAILHDLWKDGDEVVRTRLRELLLRMEEVSPDHFGRRIQALNAEGVDLEPLWEPLRLRRAERCEAWLAWLNGDGQQPTVQTRPVHTSSGEAPEALPSVDDALDVLDQELGFLD